MASSLGESFCSRILDVGRAGERAGVQVCGCAGGIGRWSLGVYGTTRQMVSQQLVLNSKEDRM